MRRTNERKKIQNVKVYRVDVHNTDNGGGKKEEE